MTAAEQSRQIEASECRSAELLSPRPGRRTGRAYRRVMHRLKFKRLFRIVTRSYRTYAGYVDWTDDGVHWKPVGKYIKYPKNSHRQKWCKKLSRRMVRRYEELPPKGNGYRRVFDYWWTLD